MPRPQAPTVFHYYARYLVHPSGVTDSVNNWVAALVANGISTRIVAAKPAVIGNEFVDAERTITTGHLGRGRSTWIPLGLLKTLRKGDLLVLHEGWVISNVVAAAIAKLRRVPYVVVPHGVYERGVIDATKDVAGVRSAAERWALRNAAAVHVFYGGETDVVKDLEPGTSSFMVHPNGAPVSDPVWKGDGDFYVWIGRFDPHHKGLDNLVRSWSRLPEPRPRLVLAGPDFLGGRDQIAEQIAALGLDETISIRGRVSGDEKADLMRGARAYVHPSRWESCSIMLLEMLGAGVPSVVSSSIHAADELGPSGVVLVADFASDNGGLAEALEQADRNTALGNRARAWVDDEGSWAAVGPDYASDVHKIQRSYA
ncbi:glycosyltransferase [Microbacterium allomyrinae]|jgi:glycosyltransferase involved in cell wall biosynthesis|uniref:Glycosyltransferase n=1 Tax=Microbacterium allomyrinae TaxID=2830666 RepID=A0A9X1LXQ5_9MICO|nr:glycosyltransferase [Microbacterium allomyrinae]MCC2034059.1 glycosyltransferase [Microbacterium allomyrinae]